MDIFQIEMADDASLVAPHQHQVCGATLDHTQGLFEDVIQNIIQVQAAVESCGGLG